MIDDQQFADLLLLHELVDEERLKRGRRMQERHGGDFYTVLIENGLIPEEQAITIVAEMLAVPCVSLKDFKAGAEIAALLPASLAAHHRAIPLGLSETIDGPQLFLAMSNPVDMIALEEITSYTGYEIVRFLAGPLDIDQTLERLYGSAIYRPRARASLEALFDADAADPSSDKSGGFSGPSVSEILEMPILGETQLPGAKIHLSGLRRRRRSSAARHESASFDPPAQDASSFDDSFSSRLEVSEAEPSHTKIDAPPMLLRGREPIVDLAQLLNQDAESLLEEAFVGLEGVQEDELFTLSGSKIFMAPESLTEVGRQRLQEARKERRDPLRESSPRESTQLGAIGKVGGVVSDFSSHGPLHEQPSTMVLGGIRGLMLSSESGDEDSEPEVELEVPMPSSFDLPRIPTNRVLRSLQEGEEDLLAALLARTPDRALLEVVVNLLLKTGLIHREELQSHLLAKLEEEE